MNFHKCTQKSEPHEACIHADKKKYAKKKQELIYVENFSRGVFRGKFVSLLFVQHKRTHTP